MAAAGKEQSVSIDLFVEVNELEVEEEISIVPTIFWAEGAWMGRWRGGNG